MNRERLFVNTKLRHEDVQSYFNNSIREPVLKQEYFTLTIDKIKVNTLIMTTQHLNRMGSKHGRKEDTYFEKYDFSLGVSSLFQGRKHASTKTTPVLVAVF